MREATIQCSSCGAHIKLKHSFIEIVQEGEGSCGTAVYCPECVQRFKKISPDREMNSDVGTIQAAEEYLKRTNNL